MSHAKQASTKLKRSINAVPVLSAAGLSLSLASGAFAAMGRPAADMPTSHEITLCEEEISDVSLATFYVFDNEKAGTFRRRIKLAAGGCGGCGGCGTVAAVKAAPAPILEPRLLAAMLPRRATRSPRAKDAQARKRGHIAGHQVPAGLVARADKVIE